MSQIDAKLSQLRGYFIICFVAQLIVDFILGWDLIRNERGGVRGYGLGRLNLSSGTLLILALIIAGILLALGLWLFRQLLLKKNWARIVLLVVGWVTVADALSSFLITSGVGGFMSWLDSLEPGLHWPRVVLIDRTKDFIGLIFWGYLIYILQFKPEVKREFCAPAHASGLDKDK